MVVYKITNKINGKAYIGQTTESLRRRWSRHCREESHCTVLKNAIKKYGREAFSVKTLFTTDSMQDLNHMESYFINKFNSLTPNGYNMTSGGSNPAATLEVKRKLSILNSGENHPMFGKQHSEYSKKKISASVSGKYHPLFGKPCSEERKAKISLGNRGKKRSAAFVEKCKKSVLCVETGEVYASVSDTARDLSVSISAISNVLRGKSNSCKGFSFVYNEATNV